MAVTLLVVGVFDVLAGASVVGGAFFTAFIGGLLNLLLLLLLPQLLLLMLLLLLLLGNAALAVVDLVAAAAAAAVAGGAGGGGGGGEDAGTTGLTSTAFVADNEVELVAPSPESKAAARALPMPLLFTMVICTSALMTCSLGCVSR